MTTFNRLSFVLTLSLLHALAAPAFAAAENSTAKRAALTQTKTITLDFEQAEIADVATTIATLMGFNVVVDPRVKGQITLTTTTPVTPGEALLLFSARLRTQGYAITENNGIYMVLPEAEAKLRIGRLSNTSKHNAEQGQVVTRIYQLTYEDATAMVAVLRPLISPNNTINAIADSNALVITDYADNLLRLESIIRSLDVDTQTGLSVIRLKYALAIEVAPLVTELLESSPTRGRAKPADGAGSSTVLAEPRTNSLLIRGANEAKLSLINAITKQLDQPDALGSAAASGNIHVVYLKNADASELANTLRAALTSAVTQGASSAPAAANTPPGNGGNKAALAASTTGGQIQADTATNSLVITAPEPQYRQLRAVIDQLDNRRAQVYVESLIAEISADKAAEFGVQWQGALGGAGSTNIGLLGTNFRAGGANIVDVSKDIAAGTINPSTGINFGIAHMTNGVRTLGLLARFLESSGDANVLSTPNLVTLDNHEAKIVIGQNVPFVTGQYTNNNSNSGAVNPFQTVERKDVGLTLRVKPQISENGTIKMQIFQEVSRLDPASVNSASGLITQKRSIESNVLVEDGSIVVLGGLLQDAYGTTEEKVPGLGDIPVFGALFRSEQLSRKKTNLMIFLRPVILRDGQTSQNFSQQRYGTIRQQQIDTQPTADDRSPDKASAVLPAIQLP